MTASWAGSDSSSCSRDCFVATVTSIDAWVFEIYSLAPINFQLESLYKKWPDFLIFFFGKWREFKNSNIFLTCLSTSTHSCSMSSAMSTLLILYEVIWKGTVGYGRYGRASMQAEGQMRKFWMKWPDRCVEIETLALYTRLRWWEWRLDCVLAEMV